MCPASPSCGKTVAQAIAVYNPDDPERVGFKKCYQLSTHADRVRHIAPADFRPGRHLRMLLEQMVDEIANRIVRATPRRAIETGTVRAPRALSAAVWQNARSLPR